MQLLVSDLVGVSYLYLCLLPLLAVGLLHLKVDPLDPATLAQDLDAAHTLLEVVYQPLALGEVKVGGGRGCQGGGKDKVKRVSPEPPKRAQHTPGSTP